MNDYMVVKPTEVKLKEDMPRFRKEMGDIKDLVASFKKVGQLQPVLVTRDMTLVAGGRRLIACIDAEMDVKVVFTDEVDYVMLREMEIEENIRRKAFTAAEEIMAVQELHTLKQTINGAAVQGSDKGTGWRIDDTAAIIGKSRASVIGDLSLAEALKNFPVLANCKTKADIKRAVKGLERIHQSVQALETYDEVMKDKEDMFELHNADCIEFMKGMEDKSVDILFTDPPYGIDIHDITIGLGGKTGSDITMSGFQYDDGFEAAMDLMNKLAVESARIVKDTGFAVVFCAISHFWIVRSMFEAAGWNCSQRPLIWIKNESGQNNAPSKWMSAGYESMLFARKPDARIVIEGKVDWIQCPNVTSSVRIHQAEKPVPLIKEILSRLGLVGAIVFDPFSGSAATIEAAIDNKMYVIGCEKLLEAYATGKQRIINYFKMKEK